MRENTAQMIGRNLAEIGRASAKACHTCCGISGTATRHFCCRTCNPAIEQFSTLCIDQVHRAFDDSIRFQKRVISARKNIDNGIADAKNVECGHEREKLPF